MYPSQYREMVGLGGKKAGVMWFKWEEIERQRDRWGVAMKRRRRKNSAKKYQLNDFHIIAAIYNTEVFIFDTCKSTHTHTRQEYANRCSGGRKKHRELKKIWRWNFFALRMLIWLVFCVVKYQHGSFSRSLSLRLYLFVLFYRCDVCLFRLLSMIWY